MKFELLLLFHTSENVPEAILALHSSKHHHTEMKKKIVNAIFVSSSENIQFTLRYKPTLVYFC